MAKASGAAVGKVWLVGAGPGEPDLITWRGRELLERAEVVLYDALSHPELLELCPQAQLIDVGKRYGERATPQGEITTLLLQFARAGQRVVRLKGGDPLVFARGAEEALALAEAGVPFEIVPGITSPIGAAAFAGISLTHRDLSSSVTFITGSDQDGKEWSPEAWQKLATATGTICVLMGMRRLEEITAALLAGGRSRETPAAVVQWGARPEQRTIVGTLGDIAERARQAGLRSPAIVFVGEVVSLRSALAWYEAKPLFGKRILVPRPLHQARATSAAIRERGARAVLRPALDIAPPPDPGALERAILGAASYDWVVFTSVNGVLALERVLEGTGKDARIFGTARLAVIGEKTAAALRRLGLRADLVAPEYIAESLSEALLAELAPQSRVLLVRALVARALLPEALAAAGHHVDIVAAYETNAVSGSELRALQAALETEVDVVLFTSSSMVDAVVTALGSEARRVLSGLLVASIGPVTSATLGKHGIPIGARADVHTVDGLLDALERHFSA